MDEFFAAVEKLDRPELRGKCLLIGGEAEGRGVVATASYEARAFGCHSAMPMATAIRLCPQAIVLPVRGERYRQASEQVFAIFDRFTPLIEPLSVDEAFLDVTGSERLHGPPLQIARKIKAAIRQEVSLTASVGVAPNKYLAKVASDLQKPDGLAEITDANVHQTLDGLPVRKIWGVGPAAEKQFQRLGIRTIGKLRSLSPAVLEATFGRQAAEHYLQLANGIDDRDVIPDSQARSIGQEETFPVNVGELQELRCVLLEQVVQVGRRLRRGRLQAHTVTIKLRYGDFTTVTRSATIRQPTDATQELWAAGESLLTQWAKKDFRPLRLLGMTASGLKGSGQDGQLSLFQDPQRDKQRQLDRALDDIIERFGASAIQRGPKRSD